jgi:hypothetical protein
MSPLQGFRIRFFCLPVVYTTGYITKPLRATPLSIFWQQIVDIGLNWAGHNKEIKGKTRLR